MGLGHAMAIGLAVLCGVVQRALARSLRGSLAIAFALIAPTVAYAQSASTVTLTAAPTPSAYGQSVTLTATVSGTNPSGPVSFMDGATTLGTATLSGTANTATVTLAVTTLSVGTHSLTAAYAGDANNGSSTSAAITQVVNAASTTTTLSASPNPSTYLGTVTFTATVAGQQPTGSITFKDGANVLGTASLAGSGNSVAASFATSSLTIASHSITAVYAGDANNNTSTSSSVSEVVNKASTTTGVSANVNPSNFSQTVTFTASVTGVAGPTGTVTFKDGSTSLGTGTLSGGTATYSTAALAVGTHSITAVYGGDSSSNTSTSAAMSEVTHTDPTGITLTSTANPSTAGQGITLTAVVTGASPTGNVTFQDGTTVLGTRALTAGSASLLVTTFAAGTHSLTANYAGDSNNSTSTATLSQAVSIAATNVVLVVPQSATTGQNVTLVAQVNGFEPSGVVTFTDSGNSIGTGSVQGGVASLAVNGLGVGSHTLGATYPGDSNNAAANASTVNLTVNARSGMTWQYGYDAQGRPNTVVDPNGQSTYFYYDSLGRRIQTQQPPNTGSSSPTVTQFGYDGMDSLTSVADPRNLSTTYTRNGLGEPSAQSSPDSGNSTFTYDAKGRVLTSTDARSKTTTFAYDALDRVTSVSYPTGTATTFEYDGGANPTPAAAGEVTKMADESGQTVYGYDGAGRLSSKTVAIGAMSFTVRYTWGDTGSALDKLVAITYPSGNQVNYSYDSYGSVSGITVSPVNANGQGVGGTPITLLSGITYNADNKVIGWTWTDGKARTIGYDSNGLVSSYNLGDPSGTGATAGLLRTVTRDAAGRITGYTHTNNGSPASSFDQGFAYDNLDRLTSDTQGSSTTQYSYDATGNRTAKTIGGTTYTVTVDPASNRLTQVQDVTGTGTIAHDSAGNIVGDVSFTYTYSDRGRLSSVTTGGGTVGYLYNGLGQRVQKSGPITLVASGVSYYVYDEAGKLLGEYDTNGNPAYETIYLGELPTGVLKQTGTAATNDIAVSVYNLHADHIATPRVITAQDETIVWRWDTAEAFGATAPDQNPNGAGTFVFNQRFPGQVFDAETGLFQNWNREYNARTGRYTQSDPIGLGGGLNTYAYVRGNPLIGVDPRGLATFTATGGGSAVIVGGGEGSVGIYFSNKPNDIGIVISGGMGGGANVGLSAQFGYVPGPLSNVSGTTTNYNASCVIGSGTWMTDPKTGAFAGASIGPAGRLGGSVTNAETRTYGLRDAFDWLFNKLGGIQ